MNNYPALNKARFDPASEATDHRTYRTPRERRI
jgi:hypothetical protein